MSVIFVEGYDMYNGIGATTGGLGSRWATTSAPALVGGRFGGQGVQLQGNSATWITQFTLSPSVSAVALGFALNVFTGSPGIFLTLGSDTTAQVGFQLNANGSVNVCRMASRTAVAAVLGTTAPGSIINNAWQYFEAEIVISDTAGRFDLWLDGVQVLSLGNTLDTQNGAPTNVDTIAIGNFSFGGTFTIDDMYMTDVATRLGERKVETLRPAADSAVQWTPRTGATNFNMVNAATVNTADYVSASTVGDRDLYTIAPLSSTPTVIDAIQVVSFATKTDANTREIFNTIQSATVDDDGPAVALTASFTRFSRLILDDPATSAAWTPPGINNLLIGPQVAV